ncbi:ORF6N domain-containing protein [Clostridium sp. C2-6-12]|uniref:ORF6N domain-containing protein n=1 Tax=Clostridium sp. C2-6-12 TaxID=2698832 RepID=UPI00136B470C|nr:ORF6N domain-containing protein [Clostridium sp. C2-6-12]
MDKLIPMEYENQRIMTTKVLAEEFGTEDKIISNNFNRNINRFVKDKHYYKLEGSELKAFKGYHQNDESLKYVSVLYLWTERGAARHAKILDTDEA